MRIASVASEDWQLDLRYETLNDEKRRFPLGSLLIQNTALENECQKILRAFRIAKSNLINELAQGCQSRHNSDFADRAYVQLTDIHREIGVQRSVQQLTASLHHPCVEISVAEPRMASATLSHIAYELSDETGDCVENELFGLGNCQGHLHNVASSIYRQGTIDRGKIETAIQLLQRMPVRSSMNHRLMSRLLRDGFIQGGIYVR